MPPYNGSGSFGPFTPGNPVVTGSVIGSTAFNATIQDIAAGLSNAVTRDGQSPLTANLPAAGRKITGLGAGVVAGDSLRFEQLFSQGTEQDIASAATVDIGGLNTTIARITGTTTITSFGTNYNGPRYVRFAGALTLTHNATTLILPGGANITTTVGDRAILTPVGSPGSGWQVLAYERANGTGVNGAAAGPVTASGLTMATARILGRSTAGIGSVEELTGASAQSLLPINQARVDVTSSGGNINLTTQAPNTDHVNITSTEAITSFTVAAGRLIFARFGAALTLTNNANIVTQTGANITTANGDSCILRATAANVVEVLCYVRAANVTPSVNIVAWCTFNGKTTGTNAPTASFNVTNITRNGTGDYTINFTSSLADANYAIAPSVNNVDSPASLLTISNTNPPTTTQCRVITGNGSGTGTEPSRITLIFVR